MMMRYLLLNFGVYWMLFFMLIVALVFAFWLWMFIEALKRRDVLWITLLLVSLFTGVLTLLFALLYYLLEYTKGRERKKFIRKGLIRK